MNTSYNLLTTWPIILLDFPTVVKRWHSSDNLAFSCFPWETYESELSCGRHWLLILSLGAAYQVFFIAYSGTMLQSVWLASWRWWWTIAYILIVLLWRIQAQVVMATDGNIVLNIIIHTIKLYHFKLALVTRCPKEVTASTSCSTASRSCSLHAKHAEPPCEHNSFYTVRLFYAVPTVCVQVFHALEYVLGLFACSSLVSIRTALITNQWQPIACLLSHLVVISVICKCKVRVRSTYTFSHPSTVT